MSELMQHDRIQVELSRARRNGEVGIPWLHKVEPHVTVVEQAASAIGGRIGKNDGIHHVSIGILSAIDRPPNGILYGSAFIENGWKRHLVEGIGRAQGKGIGKSCSQYPERECAPDWTGPEEQ